MRYNIISNIKKILLKLEFSNGIILMSTDLRKNAVTCPEFSVSPVLYLKQS